jgi:Amt family ammonium transporter
MKFVRRALAIGAINILALALSGRAFAAEESAIDSGDTAWLLTATAIVLMMTIPGLALFYGGMVRKKNVLSMLMQSFAITCVVSLVWMIAGYSLTFANGGAFYGSFDNVLLLGLTPDSVSGTIPEALFVIFQMTFAIITLALITGATAERMKFGALLVFVVIWTLAVYVPVAHWVWGGGFLSDAGVLDFAGGTVVHINSGVAALVAALVLGQRIGFQKENIAPHNLTLSVVGAGLLWVGWFGFNAGSALAADGAASMAMIVTQIASACAALIWMLAEWLLTGKPSVLGIISGAIAGLVAITPAAGFVNAAGALAIGGIGGMACFAAAYWLKRRLRYDDSLDVFAVHGIGGMVGAILTGVFATEAIGGAAGAIDGNGGQVLTQLYGVAVTIAYTGVVTFVILKAIDLTIGLRVTEESEREGLDIRAHGESVA